MKEFVKPILVFITITLISLILLSAIIINLASNDTGTMAICTSFLIGINVTCTWLIIEKINKSK